MKDIKKLCQKDIREAKRILAFEVTKLVHGEEEALKAKQTSEDLFSNKGDSENMPIFTITSKNINLIDLLVETKLVPSKSEARRLIEQNGISINQVKESNPNRIINESDFKEGFLIIQKGKKNFLKIKIEA